MEKGKIGRLFVRNLNFSTTEKVLLEHFEKFGKVSEINLLKKNEKIIGCGFVQFTNYRDAEQAVNTLNGSVLSGRKIKVEFAVSKERYSKIKKEDPIDTKSTENAKVHRKKKNKSKADVIAETKEIKTDLEDQQEDDENNTVFIKNLSFDTTDEDLKECFSQFGSVKYALIVKDKISNHSKGSGFVKFFKSESAQLCLKQSGQLILQNFTLEILPSLIKSKIKIIEDKKQQDRESKDGRNLYLLREGTVLAGSSSAEGVSASDMSKRLRLEQIKSSMLKNLNRFISRERLTIHNLPESFDDEKLRQLVIKWTECKPKECRVMRENKPSAGYPKGKPKEFGFLSFKTHEEALAVLRKLNNNPKVFSAHHRPILSFSIEDKQVHNIKEKRLQRSLQNNPTYQKKMGIKKPTKKTPKSIAKLSTEENVDKSDNYTGFVSKPGTATKMRGNFKLKQQSIIHEKTRKSELKNKRMKQNRAAKKEQIGRPLKTKMKKTLNDDALGKKIEKYKSLLSSDIMSAKAPKKQKLRQKWYTEDV